MRKLKKIVSFTLVILLSVIVLPAFNSFAFAASDVAQGKKATASSSLNGYYASNVNDLYNSTLWCASNDSLPQWWKVDLGGNYDLTSATITLAPTSATFAYKIEVSTDDSSYSAVVDKTSKNYTGTQTGNFTVKSVRYVKITITGSASGDWASLSKVQVFGTASIDNNAVPNLQGRVIYHNYSTYGDGNSQLYIANLGTKTLSCISSLWTNVTDAMNAVWSTDGKKIVFMGRDKLNGSWDLYSYTIGLKGNPTNLTNSSENRDEDPKFYPGSSTKIIFKSTYGGSYYIKTMDIGTKAVSTIYSSTSMECSMPYYSSDGTNVYFSGLAGGETDIYKISASGGTPLKVSGGADSGIKEYYPVTKDNTGFFYTRSIPNDMIYFKNTQTNATPISMPFNVSDSDNSDICIVNSNYSIISSNRWGGIGGYDLYICNNSNGKAWSLNYYNNGVNTSKNELGSSYTSTLN